ncbi:MAG: NAD(P)/FAD-dependent oxidoreductase, partial [Thermoplasmata archaeon]|nr:NAD(P)/FAD-dependent oxidoreductase [Thermoplasmata archaeon]
MSKVAIIGAGPAGMAATVQLVRQGHEVQVFEHGRVGGTLWNAGLVENYLGFPGGITGRHLARLMEEHFLGYIDNIIVSSVETIIKTDTGFIIEGIEFDGVILCTGTTAKKADFSGEEELEKARHLWYGITFMEHWHGAKEVGIIGGGEASMDMALSLVEAGMKVTMIHRSEPKGINSLLETMLNEENITWHQGTVKEARMHKNKAVLALDNFELPFDLVIVAVGREALMPDFEDFSLDDAPPGLLIAGDAARGELGQIATAVGDGVEMATIMGNYLRNKS